MLKTKELLDGIEFFVTVVNVSEFSSLVCSCGYQNITDRVIEDLCDLSLAGFHACDTKGDIIVTRAALNTWDGLFKCEKCGILYRLGKEEGLKEGYLYTNCGLDFKGTLLHLSKEVCCLENKKNLYVGGVTSVLDNLLTLKNGTDVVISHANTDVAKHSGDYYVLFNTCIDEAYIWYRAKNSSYVCIYYSSVFNVFSNLDKYIASGYTFKFLKEQNKKTYKLMVSDSAKIIWNCVEKEYTNSFNNICLESEMFLTDAIKLALFKRSKDWGKSFNYDIYTKKNKILLSL